MTADILNKAAERNIIQRCVKEKGLNKLWNFKIYFLYEWLRQKKLSLYN